MIVFNRPSVTRKEERYVLEAMNSQVLSGNGFFNKSCEKWFEINLPCERALFVPSCTAALELAALLIDIRPGDEIIMPSYTFVSTANAFVLRGAKVVFVDINPETMNIDERLIEAAITEKTRAIVPVHYAGVACEMDVIMDIANKYKIFVIEDAAQGMMSTYKGKALGTIGHFGAFSFHETKNYTSGGEGGLLIINDSSFKDRAEIIREKGTNRSQFIFGQVDKYQWVDIGSSYLSSELQAAFLWGQLKRVDEILSNRIEIWKLYYDAFYSLNSEGKIELPVILEYCSHNAHIFYLKTSGIEERGALISYLRERDIVAVFHYVPLHTALAGENFSFFKGDDIYTTRESERLVRLPIWCGLSIEDQLSVISAVKDFYIN